MRILFKASGKHDVSGEKRDAKGEWTIDGVKRKNTHGGTHDPTIMYWHGKSGGDRHAEFQGVTFEIKPTGKDIGIGPARDAEANDLFINGHLEATHTHGECLSVGEYRASQIRDGKWKPKPRRS